MIATPICSQIFFKKLLTAGPDFLVAAPMTEFNIINNQIHTSTPTIFLIPLKFQPESRILPLLHTSLRLHHTTQWLDHPIDRPLELLEPALVIGDTVCARLLQQQQLLRVMTSTGRSRDNRWPASLDQQFFQWWNRHRKFSWWLMACWFVMVALWQPVFATVHWWPH